MPARVQVLAGSLGDISQDLAQHGPIGTRRQRPFLSLAQPGGRDHFHGLGDLLRVPHRTDAPPDVNQTWHATEADSAFYLDFCSCTKRLLNSPTAAVIWPFSASSSAFFSRMVDSIPGCAFSTNLARPSSKARHWSSSRSSRNPSVPAEIIRTCFSA